MKKTFYFSGLVTALAIFSIVGCQKEQAQPMDSPSAAGDLVTFTAEYEDALSDSTKVYFNDLDGDIAQQYWSKGDQISLFSGTTNNAFTNTNTNGPHAVFEGTAGAASEYCAMYPYQEGATIAGTVITGTFPQEQTVSWNGGTAKGALVSVARTEGTNFKFYNTFGLIKFKFEEDTDIQAIIIEGNDGELLSGTFTVDASSSEPVCTIAEDGGKTNIVLKATYDGTAYESFNAGTYAVTIPPTTFTKGFKIIYRKADGSCSIKSFKSQVIVARNNALNYAENSSIKPSEEYKYYYILTKEDLDQWANNSANWASTDVVYLGADIDYGAESAWSTPVELFPGTFDGRGYTISNLGAPFFNKIDEGATVKNLTLNSTFTYDANTPDTEEYGVGILAHYALDGSTLSGITTRGAMNVTFAPSAHQYNVGGIVGASNGAIMTDCTNEAALTYAPADSLADYVAFGGVAGATQTTNRTYKECSNTGTLSIAVKSKADIRAGGIFGYSSKSNTFDSCTNGGPLTVTAGNANLYAGGIMGKCSYTSKFTGCNNTGALQCNGNVSGEVCAGGIVADLSSETKYSPSIKNSGNTGGISSSVASVNVFIGGISGYTSYTDYEGCTNTGTVENTAEPSSDCRILVGGIMGKGNGEFTVTGCTNGVDGTSKGAVSNSSPSGASTISVGGIAGSVCGVSASTLYATLSSCKNYGPVTNSGTSTSTQPGTRIGGLVGWSDQCVDLTSANENHGTVTESSSSTYPTVGGVTGYVNDANSKLAGCANYGAVTASGESVTNCFVGGIVAYVNANATLSSQETPTKNYGAITASPKSVSVLEVGGVLAYTSKIPAINYAENHGNITSENVTVSSRINLGGVVGAHDNKTAATMTGMSNEGVISATGLTATKGLVCFFGGIAGGHQDCTNKIYSSCSSTGNITVYSGTKSDLTGPRLYVGGIMGYGAKNPVNSTCSADIRVLDYHMTLTKSCSCVGGICGYSTAGGGAYSNVSYEGTLNTTSSSPVAYTAGIIGRTAATSGTFTSCKVKGKISGVTDGASVGLILCNNAANTITFSDCKVLNGTKILKSTWQTLSTGTELSAAYICGGTATTGDVSGCTVVDTF